MKINKLIFRTIAFTLIQAFICLDLCRAGSGELKSSLAPRLRVDAQTSIFNEIYNKWGKAPGLPLNVLSEQAFLNRIVFPSEENSEIVFINERSADISPAIRKQQPDSLRVIVMDKARQMDKEEISRLYDQYIIKAQGNLVIAEDAASHAVYVLTPEYGIWKFKDRIEFVDNIFTLMNIRMKRTRFAVIYKPNKPSKTIPPHLKEFRKYGRLMAEYGLLPAYGKGTFGNMSVKDETFVVTGLGVNKGNLKADDLVEISGVNIDKKEIYAIGTKEPSTETIVHSQLYSKRNDIHAIVHAHLSEEEIDAWKNFLPITEHPFACGTWELANEAEKPAKDNNLFLLTHHGLISLGRDLNQATKRSLLIANNIYPVDKFNLDAFQVSGRLGVNSLVKQLAANLGSLAGKEIVLKLNGDKDIYQALELISRFKKEGVKISLILNERVADYVPLLTWKVLAQGEVVKESVVLNAPHKYAHLAKKDGLVIIGRDEDISPEKIAFMSDIAAGMRGPVMAAAGIKGRIIAGELKNREKLLQGKKILIGISGGIAAYKIIDLARLLKKLGAEIRVIMTPSATQFVNPKAFEHIIGAPALVEQFDEFSDWKPEHIDLAEWPDLMLVAPATANTIAKINQGLADNLLTTTLTAVTAPVLVVPSMNVKMYKNEAVQKNIRGLYGKNNYHVLDPASGMLACGYVGKGKLPEIEDIIKALAEIVEKENLPRPLKGLADQLKTIRINADNLPADITRAAIGVLLRKDKNGYSILLTKRKTTMSYGGLWVVPGGKAERGEGIRETLAREIKEETNIDINHGVMLGNLPPIYNESDKNILFPAVVYLPNDINYKRQEEEIEDEMWISLSDIFQEDLYGHDGKRIKISSGTRTVLLETLENLSKAMLGALNKDLLEENVLQSMFTQYLSRPEALTEMMDYLYAEKDLAGKTVVVTAGPNQELIPQTDMYITNRSSGKQGFAIAAAAARRGAEVILISGPSDLDTPIGVKRIEVKNAEQMLRVLFSYIDKADAVIGAAAVADFTAKELRSDSEGAKIPLANNPDILRKAGKIKARIKPDLVIVGFAAETNDLLQNAAEKIKKKNLDFIVANKINEPGAGFMVDTNKVVILRGDGSSEEYSGLKTDIARVIVDKIKPLLNPEPITAPGRETQAISQYLAEMRQADLGLAQFYQPLKDKVVTIRIAETAYILKALKITEALNRLGTEKINIIISRRAYQRLPQVVKETLKFFRVNLLFDDYQNSGHADLVLNLGEKKYSEANLMSGQVIKTASLEEATDDIVSDIVKRLTRQDLLGKKIVITTGATEDPFDQVRVIGRPARNELGYLAAELAVNRGAEVVLISGPSILTPPVGVKFISAKTSKKMFDYLGEEAENAALILNLAKLPLFTPATISEHKIKREKGLAELFVVDNLSLEQALPSAVNHIASEQIEGLGSQVFKAINEVLDKAGKGDDPISVVSDPKWYLAPPSVLTDATHPKIRNKTAELISGSHTDLEKTEKIVRFVGKNIRYSFDSWDVAAEETLAKLEGMCANRSNLAIAMLRAAGISARFKAVWLSKESLSDSTTEMYFERIFNETRHYLVEVFIGGQWREVDPGRVSGYGSVFDTAIPEQLLMPGKSEIYAAMEDIVRARMTYGAQITRDPLFKEISDIYMEQAERVEPAIFLPEETKIIGLLGMIGSGKTTAMKILEVEGAYVINLDEIGHKVREVPGVKEKIVKAFGREILDDNGNIDRDILGEIVFSNDAEREKLMEIMLPLMKQETEAAITRAKQQGEKLIIVEGAVLFDMGLGREMDEVWMAVTNDHIRKERLKELRLMNEERIKKIDRVQRKMLAPFMDNGAVFQINNDGRISDLVDQVRARMKILKEKKHTVISDILFKQENQREKKEGWLIAPHGGEFEKLGLNDLGDKSKALAKGLMAMGIEKGERVAMISEDRKEFIFADFGILSIGAVNVPIFASNSKEQAEYRLKDSGAKVVIVSDAEQLKKVLAVKKNLPDLEKIVVVDDIDQTGFNGVITLADVYKLGEGIAEEKFSQRLKMVRPDDWATVTYTSGTTGKAKGVVLTHRNILSQVWGMAEKLPLTSGDVLLSYLPLAHMGGRSNVYYAISCGAALVLPHSRDITAVQADIKAIKPTVIFGVPSLLNRLHELAIKLIRDNRLDENKEPDIEKIKEILQGLTGGRLKYIQEGGDFLSEEVVRFFDKFGIKVLEAYGLTETASGITYNTANERMIGTVGRPVEGVELRIDPANSEVLVRGPTVMQEYLNKSAQTREVLSKAWFHTGDSGEIIDGFLKITGRIKDLLITSGGTNIARRPIEEAILNSEYISQAHLIGNSQKYITALIVPDMEKLRQVARNEERKGSVYFTRDRDILNSRVIQGYIWQEIEKVNKTLDEFERIQRVAILPSPFSVESGELGSLGKKEYKTIEQKHARTIALLYQQPREVKVIVERVIDAERQAKIDQTRVKSEIKKVKPEFFRGVTGFDPERLAHLKHILGGEEASRNAFTKMEAYYAASADIAVYALYYEGEVAGRVVVDEKTRNLVEAIVLERFKGNYLGDVILEFLKEKYKNFVAPVPTKVPMAEFLAKRGLREETKRMVNGIEYTWFAWGEGGEITGETNTSVDKSEQRQWSPASDVITIRDDLNRIVGSVQKDGSAVLLVEQAI